jgi:murein L,D-transpeptidase YafK
LKLNSCLILVLLLASVFVPVTMALPLPAEEKLPDCMLSYRYGPEQFVIVVEKSTQSLYVYSNYNAKPVETFKITSGKKNGQKHEEGDLKTPEGIYFFQRILVGDQLPKVDDYGEKAFTLNYPNPVDKKEKRNGSGIWLHGAFADDKTENPNNSRGCVVMQNGDLVRVSKYLFLNKTPICIYNKINYDTIDNISRRRDLLIGKLKTWKEDWETKNIDKYISHYDQRFRYRRMNVPQFKAYKENLNKRYKFIRVLLSDVNIYGFKNYHVVTFNQLYLSDINHFYSKKIQYWWGDGLESLTRIAGEKTVPLPQPAKFEITKGNYMTPNQFRKQYFAQLKRNTQNIATHDFRIKNISIINNTIKFVLRRPASAQGLKVIPVLRLEHQNDDSIRYRSLEGISLKNGMPQDYSEGIAMKDVNTTIVMEKDEEYKLKRLTLVMVDGNNDFEQIITYFLNKDT